MPACICYYETLSMGCANHFLEYLKIPKNVQNFTKFLPISVNFGNFTDNVFTIIVHDNNILQIKDKGEIITNLYLYHYCLTIEKILLQISLSFLYCRSIGNITILNTFNLQNEIIFWYLWLIAEIDINTVEI